MGGRPQKREKASGRKGWELGSTWDVKWIHVGMLFRLDAFRVYVGTGRRWASVTGLRWKRENTAIGLRWYGFMLAAPP